MNNIIKNRNVSRGNIRIISDNEDKLDQNREYFIKCFDKIVTNQRNVIITTYIDN